MSDIEGRDRTLLLAHVLKKNRAWLLAHGDELELTPEQRQCYDALLARRALGEPVAYITGEAWFYGRRFEMTPAVLVPRPETEHLVDEALVYLRSAHEREPARALAVLDVGTGSGAIACTIAAEAPFCTVYATERSAAAVEAAKRNVSRLVPGGAGGSVHLELADLFPCDASLRLDCVIANLPYIPSADVPRKPDPVAFEPREATDGGPDGLCEYRRLLERLPARMHNGGLVLLEAAPPTIDALLGLARRAFPNGASTVGNDYAGRARWVAARLLDERKSIG